MGYLLLVTNKSSNILEDIETLRLLAKVVQDCCQIQVTEEHVLKNAFDIIFAFDEVISFGYRESVTLSQVKTYTEMDSHEEKLHQMIEQSKINEAKEAAKKKQLELAKVRAQTKDSGGSNMPGISSASSNFSMPSMGDVSSGMSGMSGMNDSSPPPFSSPMSMSDNSGPATISGKAPKKSMVLTKKKPGDILSGLGPSEPAPTEATEQAAEPAPAPVVNPLADPVQVRIEEKVVANLQSEGGLVGEADCQGMFQVTVLDAQKADLVCFKLGKQDQEFKYKVHPNLNKQSHANNILEVREPSRAFRANTPAPLVKWRYTTNKEAFLPISIACWPTTTAEGTQIVVELELTDTEITLENVHIRFPAAPSSKPNVSSAEPGEAVYESASGEVHWHIPVLDTNDGNGTLEFSAAADLASLLPASLEAWWRGQTKCPMDIVECYHQERKDAIDYACERFCKYELTIGG